jgi:hypothetical protein
MQMEATIVANTILSASSNSSNKVTDNKVLIWLAFLPHQDIHRQDMELQVARRQYLRPPQWVMAECLPWEACLAWEVHRWAEWERHRWAE